MLLIYHVPFVDLRPFVAGDTRRLNRPDWPNARPEIDFVRSTGLVRRRRRGGVDDWVGEHVYCDLASVRTVGAQQASFRFAYRRLFSDGVTLRACFGIELGDLANKDLPTLAKQVLDTRVRIPGNGAQDLPLWNLPKTLAAHLLRSTTRHAAGHGPSIANWLFRAGEAGFVVEHDGEAKTPPYSQTIDEVGKHCWIEYSGNSLALGSLTSASVTFRKLEAFAFTSFGFTPNVKH